MESVRQINAQPCPVPVKRETTVLDLRLKSTRLLLSEDRSRICTLSAAATARRFPSPLNTTRSASPSHVRNSLPEPTSQSLTAFGHDGCEHLPVRTEHSVVAGKRLCKSVPIRHVGLLQRLPHSISFPSGLNPIWRTLKAPPRPSGRGRLAGEDSSPFPSPENRRTADARRPASFHPG